MRLALILGLFAVYPYPKGKWRSAEVKPGVYGVLECIRVATLRIGNGLNTQCTELHL